VQKFPCIATKTGDLRVTRATNVAYRPLWKGIFSTKKEKEPKRKKAGGLMETDAAVEKQKRFFHSSLQNA